MISDKVQILVVEDDKAICNLISTTLETQGYLFYTAQTGKEAIEKAATKNPDIILLDLGLPDIDGVEVINKVRTWSRVPVIVISARSEDRDKIDALDAGADDYLTKPFSVDELLARVRATLRRVQYETSRTEKEDAVFLNGGLKIDFSAGCAYVDDKEVHLTPIEYRLLCLLARNVGKVLTHNYIIKEVWGNNVIPGDTPSLRVFMATLRKKIENVPSEPKYIQTHIGIGYRMIKIADDPGSSAEGT